ncbi:DinB family protein [Dyadobacter arcticus]|uniref:Damage-inducible protein DinB n=1 Tax=Dyadobacter arcticus TaxID=1078754 RepID=A0ABX0ULQ7_9BACT|nr:DinB family protein [Dyadobacter arcticus]NIJ53891.1 putative damage-inducible protein DinB [Dyadobacter arcticus]
MQTNEIVKMLDETTAGFSHTLAQFEPEQVNTVPFEGSWTAGQVVEHILKSETGLPDVLMGKTADTKRAADEKVPMIEGIFLDFSTKLQSPDFIIPSDGPHDQKTLLQAFQKERHEVTKLAATEDLTLTCTSFPLPQMGELTRLEWLIFIISHSKRHTHQLQNILKKVNEKVAG